MRKTLLLFTVLLFGLQGWATTFTVDGVTYTITDATNKTVAIGTGTSTAAISKSTAGAFTIPSSVSYNGDTYAVTAIGDDAFRVCEKITSVSIPTTITSIGNDSFYDCSGLKSLVIPSSVRTINAWAFYFSGLESVSIPSTVTSISVGAFAETPGLITVDSNNPNYSSRDGVLYNKTQTTLMQCPTSVAQLTIPNTVTSIAVNAFQGCSNLTSIVLPYTVMSIGFDAFQNCTNLAAINIPGSVTSIDDNAFYGCSKLSSITVDSDNQYYSSLYGVLFNKNQTILLAYPGGKKDKTYTIPNSVTSIRAYAFNQTSLKEITIPSSVSSIGRCTFIDTGLTSIYISALPSNVSLGDNAFGFFTPTRCNLYVPANSRALFAAANQWKDFVNIVETAAYTVSATANPTSAGLISGTGSFLKGSTCSLTANPTSGYTFINWTDKKGILLTNSPTLSSLVTQDTIFTANYTQSENAAKITITCNNTAGGTVSGGNGNYYKGTTQTITATVNTGYTFANWTDKQGNVVSTSLVLSFTLTQDTLLIANYTTNKYNITIAVNTTTGGSVTGAGSYNYNTGSIVTATPNDGYGFKGWINKKGTVLSTSKSYSFTLTKDTVLTANFAKTYDFVDNNGLYYKISSPTTACVTYRNSAGGDYSGDIVVPSTATINGTSYNVTAIGDSAFYNCSELTSISIANSVTSIGRYSFYFCDGLTSITMPNVITSIGANAFTYCFGLISVTLSDSLASLSGSLFTGCQRLTTIAIPNSVTAIGNSTFSACFGLTSISIPASVASIGSYAFGNCTGLKSITVDSNNPNYCSVDGVMFNKNKTSLIQYPLANTLTSYSIPNTVITIEQYAFCYNYKLTSILIPSSVTSIYSYAFDNCTNLTAIYASNSDPGKISLGSSYVFRSIPTSTCTLYVPTGSKTLYAAASQWKDFTNIVELPVYTITASVNTSTGGNISGAGSYLSGNQCKISTVPNTGYSFANWTENGTVVSTDASYTFTVTANRALVANFTENNAGDYIIAMSSNPSAGGNTTGTGRYASGATCIASATANTGYIFSNWTENGMAVSKNATDTFKVSTPRTLVANFVAGYTVTAVSNSSTRGSVTGAGGYATGTSCTLTAHANAGYAFTNWTENGNVVSRSSTYAMTVNSAHTLVANFIAGFTINAIGDATQGSITGAGAYSSGSSCTLTATANYSYVFVNWTENGTEASKDASYTFTVDQARTLVANFANKNNSINATSASTIKGTITGGGTYIYGSTCTLKATPITSYVFTGWSENGTVVSTNPSYVFTVSGPRILVANFSTVAVTVTQPTSTTLSGSIVVTPSTGFTYSLDGKTYQNSNEFPYVSIGTYNVILKNVFDGTASSPVLAVVNASGVVAANNYQIKATNCTCRDTKDGAIAATLAKALDYTVTVTGINTDTKQSVMFSGTSYNLKNLPADTYKLVFKIDFLDNYEQSFNVVITQPEDLSVLKVGAEKSRATYTLNGGTSYYVSVNDNTTETQDDNVEVSLVPGENRIKIYTEKLCQGVYEETIYNSENGQISLFPNPTSDKITIGIPGEEESVTVEILSLSGALQLKQKLVVPQSRLVDLDVSYFISGTYIVKVNGSTVNSSVKMIKK